MGGEIISVEPSRGLLSNLTVWISIVGLSLLFSTIFATSQQRNYQEEHNLVQDEQIRQLQKIVDYNTGRIASLEQKGSPVSQANTEEIQRLSIRVATVEESLWIWKGVVFGFGALITFLELMKALGFLRYAPHRKNGNGGVLS